MHLDQTSPKTCSNIRVNSPPLNLLPPPLSRWGDHEFLAQIIPKAYAYKDVSAKDIKEYIHSSSSSSGSSASSKNSNIQGIHINVQKITGDLFQVLLGKSRQRFFDSSAILWVYYVLIFSNSEEI